MSQRYDIFILNFFQWTLFTTAGVVNVTDTCNTSAWIIIINNLRKKKKNELTKLLCIPSSFAAIWNWNQFYHFICVFMIPNNISLFILLVSFKGQLLCKRIKSIFFLIWENTTTWWMNKGVFKLIYLQH